MKFTLTTSFASPDEYNGEKTVFIESDETPREAAPGESSEKVDIVIEEVSARVLQLVKDALAGTPASEHLEILMHHPELKLAISPDKSPGLNFEKPEEHIR